MTRALPRGHASRALLLRGFVLALMVMSGWFLLEAYTTLGLNPKASAHGSAVVALLGMHGVVIALLVAMIAADALWSWLRPADPRGPAVTWNTSLVAYYGLASAVIVLTTVYLGPRVW